VQCQVLPVNTASEPGLAFTGVTIASSIGPPMKRGCSNSVGWRQ
jgi:hypothetical protein